MVKQKKRTCITQSGKNCVIKLRHPCQARAWFESKRFDWFFQKPYCLLANHSPEFRCVICCGITLFAHVLHFFALVLHILHSFLRQSESSNFFMYVIGEKTVTRKWTIPHAHFYHSVALLQASWFPRNGRILWYSVLPLECTYWTELFVWICRSICLGLYATVSVDYVYGFARISNIWI